MWTLTLVTLLALYRQSFSQAQESIDFVSSLNLVNGLTTENRGLVVLTMNYSPTDGYICVDGWGDNDARVVCRMLGLTGGRAVPNDGSYGSGNRNFVLSGLQCTGTEATLDDCPKAVAISCESTAVEAVAQCDAGTRVPYQANKIVIGESVGAIKLVKPATNLDYGNNLVQGNSNVRLRTVEGVTGMGYVQVKNPATGTWGYICDDEWSELDATVVCRELNYTRLDCCARPGILEIYTTQITVVEPIVLDDVKCQGTEASIFNCVHSSWGSNNCKGLTQPGDNALTTEYAGVQCLPEVDQPFQKLPDPQVNCTAGSFLVTFVYFNSSVEWLPVRGLTGCPSASVASSSTNVVVSIPLYECGTTLTSNGTHNIYQNYLIFVRISGRAELEYAERFKYIVQCAAPIQIQTDSIRAQPVIPGQSKIFSVEYKYEVKIDFYQNPNCSILITDRPYVVNISSWVYVGVKLVTNDPRRVGSALRLVLTNCQATPTDNGVGYPRTSIVDEKCPSNDNGVSIYPINNTMEGFRYRAFQIRTGYAQVYIRCDVIICLASDTSSKCDRSCTTNKPSTGRRKRDVNTTDTTDTLSVTAVSPAIHFYNAEQLIANDGNNSLTLTLDLTLLNSHNGVASRQATNFVLCPMFVILTFLYTNM